MTEWLIAYACLSLGIALGFVCSMIVLEGTAKRFLESPVKALASFIALTLTLTILWPVGVAMVIYDRD